jgi:MoxR-like ATPase
VSTKKTASAANTLVGRSEETSLVLACLKAKRNVLLEGPVGVGKTHLALSVTESLGRKVFRVDGDNRYSEQKLSGWFDPPTVIKKGFSPEAFVAGPLVEAMQQGGVLFINELNRLPEGVQNVLLPAIDERMILVPKLGAIIAKEGFLVVATQNPKLPKATAEKLSKASVLLARMTRDHERIRRGASVRAAISVAEIAAVLIEEGDDFNKAFLKAVLMALPTRIEIELEAESDRSMREEVEALLKSWAQAVLDQLSGNSRKK